MLHETQAFHHPLASQSIGEWAACRSLSQLAACNTSIRHVEPWKQQRGRQLSRKMWATDSSESFDTFGRMSYIRKKSTDLVSSRQYPVNCLRFEARNVGREMHPMA